MDGCRRKHGHTFGHGGSLSLYVSSVIAWIEGYLLWCGGGEGGFGDVVGVNTMLEEISGVSEKLRGL